jgi:predicted ATPase/DNA-binding SARP family transcriptional activator
VPDPPPPLAISLFGPFQVCRNGLALPRLRAHKGDALLALLTLRSAASGGAREIDRAWLAGTLWPDSSTSQGLSALRRYLTDLRRALGPEAARLGSPTSHSLTLDLTGAAVDLLAFDAAVARGQRAACASAREEALEEAVALYRGPLLEEWTEEWVFEERQAREQRYLEALEALAAEALARSDGASAERHLRRAVVVDPLRESAQRRLMEALAAAGSYTAATQIYRDLRLRLHRELSGEPAAETRALYDTIRAEARRRAAGTAGAGVRTRFAPPITSPPLSPDEPHDPRHGHAVAEDARASSYLPLPLTRFIGREDQVAELEQAVAEHRLVTLTGAGGCGKTRLALAVAGELLEAFPDGVWFVDLAPLADPELAPQTVATALGLPEAPGRAPLQVLQGFLKTRRLLVVLDNCEHLIAACARLAHALLQDCPMLHVLATSREALGITGERAYRVPPLSLPGVQVCRCAGVQAGKVKDQPALVEPEYLNTRTPEYLLQSEAMRLFSDRAAAVMPSFRVTDATAAAVAQICHRLEGMPLAIELAAGRMKVLPVAQIAAGLDDTFRLLTRGSRTALPRQQTLQATLDWSYDLLTEPERALLRRLSVFAGGCTLEAAEAVCACGAGVGNWELGVGGDEVKDSPPLPAPTPNSQLLTPDEVLDLLASLVEKSLISYEDQGAEGRYRLLETVRQYAREKLMASGEAEAVHRRHAGFFTELANPWSELDLKEIEHGNFRAALNYCVKAGDAEWSVRLIVKMQDLWKNRGYLTEGRERTAAVLAIEELSKRTGLRAQALEVAFLLALCQDDYVPAQTFIEESLSIYRELNDEDGIARSLQWLGDIARDQSDYRQARSHWEQVLPIFRATGNRFATAQILHGLGTLSYFEADYDAAQARLDTSLATFQELGDSWGVMFCLHNLAEVADGRGDYEAARRLLEESIAIARERGDRLELPNNLNLLAWVEQHRGDLQRSADLCRESLEIARPAGQKHTVAKALRLLGRVELNQRDLRAARPLLTESLALYRGTGKRLGIAECLESLAGLAAAERRFTRAARCLGAAEALRETMDAPLPPPERAEYDRTLRAVRGGCGDEAFASTWAAGRAMSLDQAVCVALEAEPGG